MPDLGWAELVEPHPHEERAAMGIPTVPAWGATMVFLLLVYPCVTRLVRLDYGRLGIAVRELDLVGLLMALAMAAMVSPVGFPVPMAGWQALFVVAACWFAVGAARMRNSRAVCRHCDLYHAVSAAAMVYMFAAMPHGDAGHSVWPTMVSGDDAQRFALPAVALLCLVYFTADGLLTARRALRRRRAAADIPPGVSSRTGCRMVMSFGMAAMFAAGLVG